MSEQRVVDVVVVGAGAVGLASALALLRRRRVSALVLEAEPDVARHQTGHNSGVIHSGLYYKPGSLKAQNCVRGRDLMYAFCSEHGIAHERCGKLVLATEEDELPRLKELQRRGEANGLKGVRYVEGEELRDYEPHVRGVAALWVPDTGIVDFVEVARTYRCLLEESGAEFRFGAKLVRVVQDGHELRCITEQGEFRARNLVNCAGLYSDVVARNCGVRPDVRIIPFRGEYFVLQPDRRSLVKNLIYPVPDPRFPFLGVHLTRMIDGAVEAGPNAVLALSRTGYKRSSFNVSDTAGMLSYGGFWRMAMRYGRTGAGEMIRSLRETFFLRSLQRLVPELQRGDIKRHGAGVRAQAVGRDGKLVDDFRVIQAERMVHVLNAPSPAATASLSIGEHVADMAEEAFLWA